MGEIESVRKITETLTELSTQVLHRRNADVAHNVLRAEQKPRCHDNANHDAGDFKSAHSTPPGPWIRFYTIALENRLYFRYLELGGIILAMIA